MKICMQNKKTVGSIQIERITPFRFASFPPMVRLHYAIKNMKLFSSLPRVKVWVRGRTVSHLR